MSSEQMVAIITGASPGIGAGVVQAYRQLGYVVVANSRHLVDAIAYLETAEFITGEILHVDGGQSAGH
jgi:NADP-dependent 3-hydroxy acid dehydrogenase YdfG